MAHKLNPYFNFAGQNGDNNNERLLTTGFLTEAIQQFGQPIKYMPRTLVKEDQLYGEDVLSAFNTDSFEIEAYLENIDAFDGDGDFLSEYGVIIKDQAKIRLSRTRFDEEIVTAGLTIVRPREGDLIYLPMNNEIFEIKFVFDEDQFYPGGILPSYVLTCESFSYSMETINTGDPAVDKVSGVDLTDTITPNIGDNEEIQTQSDILVDFSENNPFGNF